MKYTLYWTHSGKEEIIIAMSRKNALRIIKRFKKKANYCDSLFIYLSRKDIPTYEGKCYGHYFKGWDGTELHQIKEA